MPGIFSYAATTHSACVTGGTAGVAADRGQGAPVPSARARAYNLLLGGAVGPAASQGEFQAVGRMFS